MMRLEVLVEGASDVPAVKEVLQRKFQWVEHEHFRIHSHRGKGRLPASPLSKPNPMHQGLLDQLPAKLKGFGKSQPNGTVLVVIDVDDTPAESLVSDLHEMLNILPYKPHVVICLAIEETESWFIADLPALERAFTKRLKKRLLRDIEPDSIVGAWEKLACALGVKPADVTGMMKYEWATCIAPHLNLDTPRSPSFANFIGTIGQLSELMAYQPIGEEFGANAA